MTVARAFWTIAPGRGELRSEILPDAAAGWCQFALLPQASHAALKRLCSRAVFLLGFTRQCGPP